MFNHAYEGLLVFRGTYLLEQHIPRSLLRPRTVDCIHLAEVPLHPKENIPAHTQAIGIFLIVSGDRVRESPSLVQDVVNLDTQVKSADVL